MSLWLKCKPASQMLFHVPTSKMAKGQAALVSRNNGTRMVFGHLYTQPSRGDVHVKELI